MFFYLRNIFLIWLFLVNTNDAFSQIVNKDVAAKIKIESVEKSLKITGTAENLSDIIQSFSYRLSVIKKNKISNNQSTNAQEGLATLEPAEVSNLSTTQISNFDQDEIIILLLLFDENQVLIGRDRVAVDEIQDNKNEVFTESNSFELSGIISDETKTKIGKDFYDFYYAIYNERKINAPKIVVISEELSFGLNTKICIIVENDVILEFMSKPDEEFLKSAAIESVQATFVYFRNKENQKKYMTQY